LKLSLQQAANGKLPSVSFIKPLGENNEHPGYSSETNGSSHLVRSSERDLQRKDAASTMVVITMTSSAGQWDHVTAAAPSCRSRA